MELEEVKVHDDFSEFEATLKQIDDILNSKDPNAEPAVPKAKTAEDFENLDVDNVRLKVRENRTVINKTADKDRPKRPEVEHVTDKDGFMREVERDANERARARAKREYEAEVQRSQGNEAFRKNNFEKAILHYTKALERVKDSAITYNNRALCYIRLRNFKRALEDCQFVLDRLKETNLRSWLYRATAYKRLNDMEKYEESVAKAREHNPNKLAYIDKFISEIEQEM